MLINNSPTTWGGGLSPVKVTGVLVGKFRKHTRRVPESCFMGVSQIPFPHQVVPTGNNNKLYSWR